MGAFALFKELISSYSAGVFAHGNVPDLPPSFHTFNGRSSLSDAYGPPCLGQSLTPYGCAMEHQKIIDISSLMSDDRVLTLRMGAGQ
jgi:hypothetical protein